MKIGVNLVRVSPGRMPEVAGAAESLGYESVFVPDHVVIPVRFESRYPATEDGGFPYPTDTPLYDPWIVLTAIGLATTRIKLGTAVYLLALRHPIVTARHSVTLEHLVGARLLLGIGAGWLREEFTTLGVDPRTRFSRLEECAAALRVLWTRTAPGFHGKHISFEGLHFAPRPKSMPCPPILFGGDSDQAIHRALRCGDGWISGGTALEPEDVRATVTRLRSAERKVAHAGMRFGSAAAPVEITMLHPAPSAEVLETMARMGVDRVVVMPWRRNSDAISELETFIGRERNVVGIEDDDDAV